MNFLSVIPVAWTSAGCKKNASTVLCLNLWLRNLSELERTSPRQTVDHEASEFVFRCARNFTATAAEEGPIREGAVRRLECQLVGAVWEFEAYNITVFHWSTILLETGRQQVDASSHLVRSPKNKGGSNI